MVNLQIYCIEYVTVILSKVKVNSSGYLPRRDGEADHSVAYTLQIPKKLVRIYHYTEKCQSLDSWRTILFLQLLRGEKYSLITSEQLVSQRAREALFPLMIHTTSVGDYESALESCQRTFDIRRSCLARKTQTQLKVTILWRSHIIPQVITNQFQWLTSVPWIPRESCLARNTQKHLKVTILWRSVTHHSLGDNESVLKTYQCALDIKRKLFRKKHLETAASYYSLVVTQYSLSDCESARTSVPLSSRESVFAKKTQTHLQVTIFLWSHNIPQVIMNQIQSLISVPLTPGESYSVSRCPSTLITCK